MHGQFARDDRAVRGHQVGWHRGLEETAHQYLRAVLADEKQIGTLAHELGAEQPIAPGDHQGLPWHCLENNNIRRGIGWYLRSGDGTRCEVIHLFRSLRLTTVSF